MTICIFDTETISINKPFCYNIGFIIIDTITKKTIYSADYVVEQIWHNPELFTSAYYSNKRKNYIKLMRGKSTEMKKWGHIMQAMKRTFKFYNVQSAYAYNSDFDENTINFNCDWFKTQNPFDDIPIYDILGYAQEYIVKSKDYKNFSEKNKLFTDSKNYSATAENVYRFINNDVNFKEDHMAFSDSVIEWEILKWCIENKNAEFDRHIQTCFSIPREKTEILTILKNKKTLFQTEFKNLKFYKKDNKIILK